jgi:hypothetical protein
MRVGERREQTNELVAGRITTVGLLCHV